MGNTKWVRLRSLKETSCTAYVKALCTLWCLFCLNWCYLRVAFFCTVPALCTALINAESLAALYGVTGDELVLTRLLELLSLVTTRLVTQDDVIYGEHHCWLTFRRAAGCAFWIVCYFAAAPNVCVQARDASSAWHCAGVCLLMVT